MGLMKINKADTSTRSTTRKVLLPEPYMDDYGILLNEDKESTKRLIKYVKALKSYIRHSEEYSRYMNFLKREGGLDRCGYHPNVTVDEFSLNVHHYPLTTEDIIYTILYKRCAQNETIRFSAVADEFMRLHYLELVGLYPLCETCHSYKHSETGKPFIPFENLFGDPVTFFELYKDFMKDKLKNKFIQLQELNKGYNILEDYIPEDLIKHYLYVTNELGMYFVSQSQLEATLKQLLKD
jgi:hypothetical protein